eukprot:PRCOL_00001452-RA
MASPQLSESDWDRMNKLKFFGYGTVAFSGLTCLLFPMSVVKTRMQVEAARGGAGARGSSNPIVQMAHTFRHVVRSEGVGGLYRGITTVLGAALPARIVYLSVLEAAKAGVGRAAQPLELSPAQVAAVSSSGGGLAASLATQAIVVPQDVISSRMMVQGSAASSGSVAYYRGPVDAIRQIVAAEGVRGLYKGFTMSVATYAPSSAIWWGSYGTYKHLFEETLLSVRGGKRAVGGGDACAGRDATARAQGQCEGVHGAVASSAADGQGHAPGVADCGRQAAAHLTYYEGLGVQAAAGFCAGLTSGTLTNPLDVIKTRLQVLQDSGGSESGGGGKRMTIRSVASDLWRAEGVAGFTRGIVPRTANVCAWGTCMVVTYEALKTLSMRPESDVDAQQT